MEYFGITDKGRVRPTNQDIYRIEACPDRDSALVLVCDGMGGANAGNVEPLCGGVFCRGGKAGA